MKPQRKLTRAERSAEKIQRAKESIRMLAIRNVRRLVSAPGDKHYDPSSDRLWSERTNRDVASIEAVRWLEASERAKTAADAPKLIGVVVVPPKIEGKAEWEAFASQPAERIAIEAVPNEKKADE